MNQLNTIIVVILLTFCLFSCNNEKSAPSTTVSGIDSETIKLFESVPANQSGLNFNNDVQENLKVNFFNYDAVYQGAGVAVGDINNDGLDDIFFAGNMSDDKLYLNKGDFKFEDITQQANIQQSEDWSTGVYIIDVNADGWKDIYVCKFLYDELPLRKNKLYINSGSKKTTFTEMAEQYGIADPGYSIAANFFDYDNDGDLDLYVANQPPNSTKAKKMLAGKKDTKYTDNLYKNNGNNTFTKVTQAAGLTNYSFSLSVTSGDVDNDGWQDLYIASDYSEPDYFYRNNGNGTFTNIANSALRHMSNFSMGADIADINNDGWLDLYTADMVAADNVRLKTNMSGMNPKQFWSLAKGGYHYQYMFNTLQINNGNGTFSDVAQLSGISNTDWSWTPLLMDLDNDGMKDLIVTNGIKKDMRNNDYNIKARQYVAAQKQAGKMEFRPEEILKFAPSVKLSNYLYKNQGDLMFKDMVTDWGFGQKTWSQGGAYADLDNDGDLDFVTNNMNDVAGLFKNQTMEKKLGNFIRIKLEGDGKNPDGLGTRVEIVSDGITQIQEASPFRGFMSCSEATIHFGVGAATSIDKLIITWPNRKQQTFENVAANQTLNIKQKDAAQNATKVKSKSSLLNQVAGNTLGLDFKHTENEYDDFKREILLPYELSHLGPCLTKADVNGDQLEDIFVGGAAGQSGKLFLQQASGQFQAAPTQPWSVHQASEDVGALFFDANGDQKPDLLVCSGGNDAEEGDKIFQDRIYFNTGGGSFQYQNNVLPRMNISTSKASAADYDQDGDMDLFIGGRQIPGQYGRTPRSFVLQNNNGKFKDVTKEVAPGLENPGMVTDAYWTDIDQDNDKDLLVVGEWMKIAVYENKDGKLTDISNAMGLENSEGWWNNILAADFDEDGDEDFIIGNLGLNIKYKASVDQPFKLYVKDFDGNGSNDVYLGYYDQDGVCYPVRGRECSSQQMPFIKKEFATYNEFAHASIEKILGDRAEDATISEAKIFASVYLENKNGKLIIHQLPNQAQIAPIYGAAAHDWNADGHLDLVVAGNYYQREVETTRSDAGIGLLLLGDGKGNFEPTHPTVSGMRSYKDVRDVALLYDDKKKPILVVANNDGPLEVYR